MRNTLAGDMVGERGCMALAVWSADTPPFTHHCQQLGKGGNIMKKTKFLLLTFVLTLFGAAVAWATPTVDLQEWGFNINGTIYDNQVYGHTSADLPVNFNTSGFDFVTGIGTITATFTTPGTYAVVGFFDHEMNQSVNGWMDETSAQVGLRPTGLSFQSETPNDVRNKWFYNGAPLQNAVEFGPAQDGMGLPGGAQTPNDIAMAIGWNFILAAGETGLVTFTVSNAATLGFYLQQSDPSFVGTGLADPSADPGSIYFTSNLDMDGGGGPQEVIPEPSTILLFVSGLALIVVGKRRLLR